MTRRAQQTRSVVDRPPEGSASGPTLAYAIVPRTVRFVNKGSWWSNSRLAKRCQRIWITGDRFRGGVEIWFGDYGLARSAWEPRRVCFAREALGPTVLCRPV
jgi:hypothetical protein